MTPALGQALRWVQRLLRVALALLLLGGIGLGALAWRLAQGPLEVALLARQVERAADAVLPGRIEVGRAAIAWEGWHEGAAAPLDIRLSEVRLLDPEGALQGSLPEVAVALSLRALLRGRLLPSTVALWRPSLLLYRDPDGNIGLEAAPAAAPPADAAPAAGPLPLDALLADLTEPPGADRTAAHAALRRIRVTDAEVTVVDRALGRRWTLSGTDLDIRRTAGGGLTAEGSATVGSGSVRVPVRLHGETSGAPARLSAGLVLPALRPSELAAIWPGLGPLRVLDAPVALAATAELGLTDGVTLSRLHARIEAEAGALDLGGGRRLPFASLQAMLEGDSRALRLTTAALRLPGPEGAPRLTATGVARLAAAGWEARLALALDPFAAAELPRLWPEALAPAAREAVLAALPAGLVREARLGLSLRAPEALEDAVLEEAQASLALEAALLDLGPELGRIAAQEVTLEARATPDALLLERATLRLPAPPSRVAPSAARRAAPPAAAPGQGRGFGGLCRCACRHGLPVNWVREKRIADEMGSNRQMSK